MNKLLERLDNKYSNQAIWTEYVKLVGLLLKQRIKKPDDVVDNSFLSRAEMKNEFSKRLTMISAATSKLLPVFNEDEKKILHLLNFEWINFYCTELMHQ